MLLLATFVSTMKKLFFSVVAPIIALSFRAQGNAGKRKTLKSFRNNNFSLKFTLPLCLAVRLIYWELTSKANSKMGHGQFRGDCSIFYPKDDYFKEPVDSILQW